MPGLGCVVADKTGMTYDEADQRCAAKGHRLAIARDHTALKLYLEEMFGSGRGIMMPKHANGARFKSITNFDTFKCILSCHFFPGQKVRLGSVGPDLRRWSDGSLVDPTLWKPGEPNLCCGGGWESLVARNH